MVKSRPILTKSITTSVIYVAADLSSQTITLPASESYDLMRTLRMAGYGIIILGPSLHFWFNFVSKVLPKKDLISTFKKILMGQTLYGPVMNVVFFSLNAFLQGENGTEIVARLKRDLLPTMIGGLMYWPACDFITFRFIPVHLQVFACSLPYCGQNCASSAYCHDVIFVLITSSFVIFVCTATCEQLIFVYMDHLLDVYGKPRKSRYHQLAETLNALETSPIKFQILLQTSHILHFWLHEKSFGFHLNQTRGMPLREHCYGSGANVGSNFGVPFFPGVIE
uniref:PXMP2/4 family protein 4-like n=1 Tax=Rhizophora mucronata TaxID=61149 RepID=A0A2P2LH14_RHIMU